MGQESSKQQQKKNCQQDDYSSEKGEKSHEKDEKSHSFGKLSLKKLGEELGGDAKND